MPDKRFTAAPVLARLKDFQLRTVDYVFDRLYGGAGTSRFLVADEVGLGKTLVARGVIARALEYLQDIVDRVDIIYVCSNTAIATQNVNRLNISDEKGFAIATRLTFLPMQVHSVTENKVNFISFTPGTTFDFKSRSGRVEERALIYKMLCGADWDVSGGLLNVLQGPVRRRNNWLRQACDWNPEIDDDLADMFRQAVTCDEMFTERLIRCCERFRNYPTSVSKSDSDERYDLIAGLRQRLAWTCLDALKPRLIILDEFQRFRNLLDDESDTDNLAQKLFSYPDVRILLLSATPYKMLSLDLEKNDDHYPDFVHTLKFLFAENANAVADIECAIEAYRRQLLAIADGNDTSLLLARDRLQTALLQVMCRTERVGMTRRLDAMLVEPARPATLEPADLDHAVTADRAARAVGAREPIEYWKSSPYLLNFLKRYDLRRRIDAVLDAPPGDLVDTLRKADGHLLQRATFEYYKEVAMANARMRVLFDDTLKRGLPSVLWMPPSLPYSRPTGSYADAAGTTKVLVFSAWNMVPDAIATICSYEAERQMVDGLDRSLKHSQLYDQLRPLLRFSRGQDDRLTGMPVIAWLLPSPRLADVVDPLQVAISRASTDSAPTLDVLIDEAEEQCRTLLSELPAGAPGNRTDERWYWAAPVMLDKSQSLMDWCARSSGWAAADAAHDPGARFRDHVQHTADVMREGMDLGPRPDDLSRVLAAIALAGPGVCALRGLRRVAPSLEPDDHRLLTAAARIAGGFRTLFNLPETIALLRGAGEEYYWKLTLQHALEGNIQALIDEQVHVLCEQLGLIDHSDAERVDAISTSLANALSIRTTQITVDELEPRGNVIKRTEFNTRCRFALRFGDLRDDRNTTVARAETVREAFNSPFRPFVLASTSIGQEGLDFHTWCHAVVHWNLPSNPVDLEQREGRVQRYKGHAVRKNVAERYGLTGLQDWDRTGDPWQYLFDLARTQRAKGSSDLIPYWVYEEGSFRVERRVPLIPFSREVGHLDRLKHSLALYRLVFGQPRQEDLLKYLSETPGAADAAAAGRVSLEPPEVQRNA